VRALPTALALLVSACPAPAPTTPKPPPLPPPVVKAPPLPVADHVVEPPPPTVRLPKNFVAASYKARLAIDPNKPTFDGAIAITGKLDARSPVIWLHAHGLDVKRASAGAVALKATQKGEDFLELRAETPLDAGLVELSLEYSGKFDSVNTTGVFVETSASLKYAFTQFEAIYARRAFPCIDEPDSKVPWQLTLDVPKDMIAVSNMPETATTALDGKTSSSRRPSRCRAIWSRSASDRSTSSTAARRSPACRSAWSRSRGAVRRPRTSRRTPRSSSIISRTGSGCRTRTPSSTSSRSR
jgi:cytosol alanyl aminopeptidase